MKKSYAVLALLGMSAVAGLSFVRVASAEPVVSSTRPAAIELGGKDGGKSFEELGGKDGGKSFEELGGKDGGKSFEELGGKDGGKSFEELGGKDGGKAVEL